VREVLSFAAAVAGWVVLEFVGRPFRRFYDLRGEVIQELVRHANVPARYKELRDSSGATSGDVTDLGLSEEQIRKLDAALDSFRMLASRMSTFAGNETVALLVAQALGYKPAKASSGLIGLSNTRDTYGPDRNFHLKTLASALKLKDVPGLVPDVPRKA
jgi:hypothetical protein